MGGPRLCCCRGKEFNSISKKEIGLEWERTLTRKESVINEIHTSNDGP
jgi:hypothetical protein